jgi:hypothetical protein
LEDFQKSNKQSLFLSYRTLDASTIGEEQAWREIQKELDSIGVTVAASDANKDFVLRWIVTTYENGELHATLPDNANPGAAISTQPSGVSTSLPQDSEPDPNAYGEAQIEEITASMDRLIAPELFLAKI